MKLKISELEYRLRQLRGVRKYNPGLDRQSAIELVYLDEMPPLVLDAVNALWDKWEHLS